MLFRSVRATLRCGLYWRGAAGLDAALGRFAARGAVDALARGGVGVHVCREVRARAYVGLRVELLNDCDYNLAALIGPGAVSLMRLAVLRINRRVAGQAVIINRVN